MSRVKRGTQARKRHTNLLARTKGFKHGRKNLVKLARQASLRAMHNAFRDRRVKKRTFRRLWIIRLNAALRTHGFTYSRFIPLMSKANIHLNRKVLSELAVQHPDLFTQIVDKVKQTA
ncbi:50S ribosomal protein L20 [Candidatus Berkelbacteria bacterium]|nr:50S ribosomal protein L20 [Candidatus Berkelbacteria bacterium]